MKSKGLAAVAITLVLFLTLTGCIIESDTSSNVEGKPAPDFQTHNLNGEEVFLSDLRGEPVVLNFWASWCRACEEEMPYLQAIDNRYSESGVNVIALNIGEDVFTVGDFLDLNKLDLTVWMDPNKAVARKYNIAGIPTTVFINGDGIIVKKVVGAFPNENTIAEIIDTYFAQ